MRGYGRNPYGDNDDDDSMRQMMGMGSDVRVMRQVVEAIEQLKSENNLLETKIKTLIDKLDKSLENLKVVSNDRKTVIEELEAYKTRFDKGETLESKYAKAMTALSAIANSVSELSSKEIAKAIIKENNE